MAEEGGGRHVFTRHVQPARVDPAKVCVHVAVQALVEPGGEHSVDIYGYHVDFLDHVERRSGHTRMVAGTVRVRSRLTAIRRSCTICGAMSLAPFTPRDRLQQQLHLGCKTWRHGWLERSPC